MKKPIIPIADDDHCMRSALRVRLPTWGYAVAESPDGLGAISQCSRSSVAVMILDHDMPNGDGRAVARMLRNECDVPIIFLSGYNREDFDSIVSEFPDIYYLPSRSTTKTCVNCWQQSSRRPVWSHHDE